MPMRAARSVGFVVSNLARTSDQVSAFCENATLLPQCIAAKATNNRIGLQQLLNMGLETSVRCSIGGGSKRRKRAMPPDSVYGGSGSRTIDHLWKRLDLSIESFGYIRP